MSLVSVSISVPSSAEVGQAFNVAGAVFEGPAPLGLVGLGPLPGVTVTIYQNGTSKGTTTTDGAGFYSKNISINQAGTFALRANALGVWSNVDYITITAPPEPPPPADIPTTLTISAPASVNPNEAFWISGILYETGTGIPLPGQPISLSYNGVNLGGALTGVDGDYLLQASIPTEGTYTLTASFAGSSTLGASEASRRTSTLEVSGLLPLLVIGGLALVFMKK